MISCRAWPVIGLLAWGVAAPLAAKPTTPCGPNGCPTTGQVGQTNIVPSDAAQFRLIGDNFRNVATEVNFGGADFAALTLNFSVNFGGGATSLAYISKNGLVSFGAPLVGFQNSSLTGLNLPVIAPYYAKLLPGANDRSPGIGDVLVQFGSADVFADGGAYSEADLLPAVRITWYGVTQDPGTPTIGGPSIYAQMVLTGTADGGYSTARFRYGPEGSPGERGAGAIAGFSLYGTALEYGGPFLGTAPTFLEFSDGRFIGQGAVTSGVPEPATWAMLVGGFGLVGFALRRRRARVAFA